MKLDVSKKLHRKRVAVAIALVAVGLGSRANAASYTYDTSGIDGISGFITTDCNSCTLNSNNIIAWAFNPGLYQVNIASSAVGSELDLDGNALVATPKAITFGFDPSPTSGDAFFKGQSGTVDFLSSATSASVYFSYPNGTGEFDICSAGCSSDYFQGTHKVFGAAVVAAPEIDSASWVSALSLLAGVLLIVKGRRRSTSNEAVGAEAGAI